MSSLARGSACSTAPRSTCGLETASSIVVLEGEGVFELWPTPQRVRDGGEREDLPIRAGHVISRPASSGVAHGIRAGSPGLTYLAYGTRNPNDVCYYLRSNKIYFRGLGLIARLEDLDYDDGEAAVGVG